jgi:hypothetical protein
MSRQREISNSPTVKNRTFPPLWQWCASQLAIASLFTLVLPSRPAHALNEFQLCAAQLVRLAGVSPVDAARACSDALSPKELSRCVVTIHRITPTLTPDALTACQRVRRPADLSRCVFDIEDNTRNPQSPAVLENCRRSLLPRRYAECVVGVSRETDIDASGAMATCIKAEDRPRNPAPTFVPPPPPNPTLPPNVPKVNIPPLDVTPATPTLPKNPFTP